MRLLKALVELHKRDRRHEVPPEVTRRIARLRKILLLIDPPEKAEAAPLANLIAFAKEYGIDVGNNIVIDASGVGRLIGTDVSVPVAAKYPTHAMTKDFRLLTAYPLARSVTAASGGANGHAAQNFIESSANSWGQTDLADLFTSGKVDNDKTKDLQGPVMLGAAMSETVGGATADFFVGTQHIAFSAHNGALAFSGGDCSAKGHLNWTVSDLGFSLSGDVVMLTITPGATGGGFAFIVVQVAVA